MHKGMDAFLDQYSVGRIDGPRKYGMNGLTFGSSEGNMDARKHENIGGWW